MLFLSLASALAIAGIIQAADIPDSHVSHEKRDELTSKQWVKREKISSMMILPMRIGLTQNNLDKGMDYLMDVSDPDSINYGKHWSSAEVIKMFAPNQQTVDAVKAWLVSSGIDSRRIFHSENKGWLAFDAFTEEAENLLHTEYYAYEHAAGHIAPACESYYVPKHIQEHIDYITPGVKLLSPERRGRKPKRSFGSHPGQQRAPPIKSIKGSLANPGPNVTTCDQFVTPACIRALYQISEIPEYPNGKPHPNNSIGVYESGDWYGQEDMDLFFSNFTAIPVGTAPITKSVDALPPTFPGGEGESELDFQLIYPLVYPQTLTLYQVDDVWYATFGAPPGAFNTFLDAIDGSYCTYKAFGETGNDAIDPAYPDPFQGFGDGYKGELMCGVYKPTNVISVSYGGQEASLPAYYQKRQCNEFMKLGLQGISIFWASGDDGVGAPPYWNENPNGCLGEGGKIFTPAFPNTCPYITNVGATKILPNRTVFDPESGVFDPAGHPWQRDYSSGGGFSNIYPSPAYQKKALSTYFDKHDPGYKHYRGNDSFGKDGGIFNRAGRGYPDVSANGDNTAVIFSGELGISGGTSASTPIFASLINRINEMRLNAGKTTVGFVNPALYANPKLLNDITEGKNPGCGTDGFKAVPGWDPVTGLGTPNYPKMVEFFMGLP